MLAPATGALQVKYRYSHSRGSFMVPGVLQEGDLKDQGGRERGGSFPPCGR